MKVFAISLIVVGAISIWLATLMAFNIGDVGGFVMLVGGGHMESTAWVYLSGIIFSIIALSGAIACIRSFMRSRRYLFASAAIYFSAGVLGASIFLFFKVPGLFRNPDYFMITDYFIMARDYILLLTLVLMIWGFFRESRA